MWFLFLLKMLSSQRDGTSNWKQPLLHRTKSCSFGAVICAVVIPDTSVLPKSSPYLPQNQENPSTATHIISPMMLGPVGVA